MARIHAFEFEDQTWFPGVVREYMTDFLSHMGGWSEIPCQPFIERWPSRSAARETLESWIYAREGEGPLWSSPGSSGSGWGGR